VARTATGRRAVEVARATRQGLNERVRAAVGSPRFAEAESALRAALDELGLGDAVRRRAVPPPDGALPE
jgi:hypothetical protein